MPPRPWGAHAAPSPPLPRLRSLVPLPPSSPVPALESQDQELAGPRERWRLWRATCQCTLGHSTLPRTGLGSSTSRGVDPGPEVPGSGCPAKETTCAHAGVPR